MAGLSQEEIQTQVKSLISKALEKEENYLWKEAIEYLQQGENLLQDTDLKYLEGEVYFKLGELHFIISNFHKTYDQVVDAFHSARSYFLKAWKLFQELKNPEKLIATLGFYNLINYNLETEEEKKDNLIRTAKNRFSEAKLISSTKKNEEFALKLLILESLALSMEIGEKCFRYDEATKFDRLASEYDQLVEDAWNKLISKENYSETLFYYFFMSLLQFSLLFLITFPTDLSSIKQYYLDLLERMEFFTKKFENSTRTLSLFTAYTFCSWLTTGLAARFANNLFEQKQYIKQADIWLKKGTELIEDVENNTVLGFFYYIRFTNALFLIYLGFFAEDFNTVLDDFNSCINHMFLLYPRINAAFAISYAVILLVVGASTPSTPEMQRIFFAEEALRITERASNEIIEWNKPSYEIFNITRKSLNCACNAILGELKTQEKEKRNHLEVTAEIFHELSQYRNETLKDTHIYQYMLMMISIAGDILARTSLRISERIKYYENLIDIYLYRKRLITTAFQLELLFLIGDTYLELGRLKNDNSIIKASSQAYLEAINYCENRGYSTLVGSGYVNLAQIEDRLGNFISAAKNYEKAINSFNKALETYTYAELRRKLEKLNQYLQAWNKIESAKSSHVKEEHRNAEKNYEDAAQILKNLREYRFEAPFYRAWAILEKAENLSKSNNHQEASETYELAKDNFNEAIENFNSYLQKKRYVQDRPRILDLIKAAEIRLNYCTARNYIEQARLESKKGNHLSSAELYDNACPLFENLCYRFKIKEEKDELSAIYHLCRAWANMERATVEQLPSLYENASNLFEKASMMFPENRMKKLAWGNSLYCTALKYGSSFDKTTDFQEKTEYYKQIKINLREAAKTYQAGGFKQDAQWVLANSTFFDGLWHVIQSDIEINFVNKKQLLDVAVKYFNAAMEIFDKAGYPSKKEEILDYLEMIETEQEILTSVVVVIEKPSISASSVGISAPACPLETSSSLDIGEMYKNDLEKESEINWHKRIQHVYVFMPNGICIFNQPFKSASEVEPELVAGGLTGISSLVQELTRNETKVKIVEQENMTILLEYGEFVNGALITEENLVTLKEKLKRLIEEVEQTYQEELKHFVGNVDLFTNMNELIENIFSSESIN